MALAFTIIAADGIALVVPEWIQFVCVVTAIATAV
jgi:hypothetical protein